MRPYVVGLLMGRCGNQFYQIATTYAYSLKHNLDFFVTDTAKNCDNDAYYFRGLPTKNLWNFDYHEKRHPNDLAIYEELQRMENVCLIGYWQSFDYFNEYREEILKLFNLPYDMKKGYVSLHIRRGDYLELPEKLSVLPKKYYDKAMEIFGKDYTYLIFSDDIEWCKTFFNDENFSGYKFEFSEGKTELEDLSLMSSCEHNICANSTFSYSASWFNRNPNKKVITPDENNMFGGMCERMIPNEYIKINVNGL